MDCTNAGLLCVANRYSTPGGYSSKAVRPIALAKVMSIAQMMRAEFPGQDKSLSGIGGVETGSHAAEFILLGANTVQVSAHLFWCLQYMSAVAFAVTFCIPSSLSLKNVFLVVLH